MENSDFESKYKRVKHILDQYSRIFQNYEKYASKGLFKVVIRTIMPCMIYIPLFPVFLIADFLKLQSAAFLFMILPFPFLLSLLFLFTGLKKVFGFQKRMEMEHLNNMRNKVFPVLYPEFKYQRAQEPKELRHLMEKGIIPLGELTYMGCLTCNVNKKSLFLFEVSVELYPAGDLSEAFNRFHGIVGVIQNLNKSEREQLLKAFLERGMEWNGAVNEEYCLLSAENVSFDQYMSAMYRKNEYSTRNPNSYRAINKEVLKSNYESIYRIKNLI